MLTCQQTYFNDDPTFLTNIDKKDRRRFQNAINEYSKVNPDVKLEIRETAYDSNHNLLKNCISIHVNKICGLGDFWEIYEATK